MDLNDVNEGLPGLLGGLSESAAPEPAPALDFSSLYGDADYEGRETAAPAPAPEPKVTAPPAANDEELRALRARVDAYDAERQSARDQEEVNRMAWQRSQESAGAYNQAMQQAAALATVPDVNPDEILGDPAKFKQWNQGLVNRAVQATMAALQPARQQLEESRTVSEQTLRNAQVAALHAASARMAEMGLGELDERERSSVVQRLQKLGRNGEVMLADRDSVVNAALMARAETGQVLPRTPAKAPTATPTTGTRRNNTGRVPMNRLPEAAQQVFKRLRIPISGDFTPDELEQLRSAGI